jgi:hypothetical protein
MVLGKIMLCSNPWSSAIVHLTVPMRLASEVPEYPSIIVCTRRGVSMKSFLLFVIDLLAPLSTNISKESVSKEMILAFLVADLLAPIQQISCDVGVKGLENFKLDTVGPLAVKRLRSNALLLIVLW